MSKIDAMVAEKVMGWVRKHDFFIRGEAWDMVRCEPSNGRVNFVYWSPSTDPAAMMVVMNHMSDTTKEHWIITAHSCACAATFEYEGGRDKPWRVGEWTGEGCGVEDLPLAVCLAALRAVGTPESEIESARISESPTPTKG